MWYKSGSSVDAVRRRTSSCRINRNIIPCCNGHVLADCSRDDYLRGTTMTAKTNPRDPKGDNRSGNNGRARDFSRIDAGNVDNGLSWHDVDSESIRAAIDAVTRGGGALLFSTSSDGGILTVMVLDGEQKPKYYPKSAEHAERILAQIENLYSEL